MAVSNNLSRIRELSLKKLEGNINPSEAKELAEWLDAHPLDALEVSATHEELEQRILAGINERITPVVPLWKKYTRIASVAAVLLLMVGGFYWFNYKNEKTENTVAQSKLKNDVLPVTTRATLTLDDGKQIVLDPKQNGLLAQENNTAINNTNGALEYSGNGDGKVHYNTLTTRKGEQFSLKLLDGSYMFVDAATTVRYPTAFIGKERTVEIINGRVWFEVAKNANQPFYAVKGDQKVRVLGTHFDVSAYDNESSMKVTLVEGSVQVISGNNSGMLKPGQQAVLSKSGNQIKVIEDADVHGVLVPSSDPHLSEYLPVRWQGREWLSGFTGSMGTLVVTRERAALFADMRYCARPSTNSRAPALIW